MIIRIKNLHLRTLVGINEWERKDFQEILLNIEMELNGHLVARTDAVQDTVDYKKITKKVIAEVEKATFGLIDTLAHHILDVVMREEKVIRARVEVDKPHALRFADSVSVVCSAERNA
jgi:D-erythro-7,8-dihydroneopterin triphosphate epimerase